jgi:hypothetical protein
MNHFHSGPHGSPFTKIHHCIYYSWRFDFPTKPELKREAAGLWSGNPDIANKPASSLSATFLTWEKEWDHKEDNCEIYRSLASPSLSLVYYLWDFYTLKLTGLESNLSSTTNSKTFILSHVQWLMPIILEAEIGRIAIWDQPRQKVHTTPISTNKSWLCGECLLIPAEWKAEIGRVWSRLAQA